MLKLIEWCQVAKVVFKTRRPLQMFLCDSLLRVGVLVLERHFRWHRVCRRRRLLRSPKMVLPGIRTAPKVCMNTDITAAGKKDCMSQGELGPGLSPTQGELEVGHGGGIAAPADFVLTKEGVGGHDFTISVEEWAATRINPEHLLEQTQRSTGSLVDLGSRDSLFSMIHL